MINTFIYGIYGIFLLIITYLLFTLIAYLSYKYNKKEEPVDKMLDKIINSKEYKV